MYFKLLLVAHTTQVMILCDFVVAIQDCMFLNFIAISIGQETASIDRKSGKVEFWKTEQVNVETSQSTLFYE